MDAGAVSGTGPSPLGKTGPLPATDQPLGFARASGRTNCTTHAAEMWPISWPPPAGSEGHTAPTASKLLALSDSFLPGNGAARVPSSGLC